MFLDRLTIFLVSVILINSTIGMEYCKLCKKGTHTLCKYKEGPADNCIEYKKPEISSSVKKYIVNVHNDIRNHVASGQEARGALGPQPSAANMNALQWDNELAEIAQRWADQCVSLDEEMQHDQCRKSIRFEVGQNVLTALTPTPDVPEIAILVLNWYKQVDNVMSSDIETFSGVQRGKFLIGQYTQLVWADTRFVGCGMSTFRNRNMSDDSARYLHRLVCNYAPRGNLIGSAVYKRGVSCTKCPYGRCDPIRTSLCKGLEDTSSAKSLKKDNSPFLVDLPASLFNTISLEYILKNNLTDVINNLIKKVDVHLGQPGRSDKVPQENLLLKTSNILYHPYVLGRVMNRDVFEISDGKVVVYDCRNHLDFCQYEDEEMPTTYPPGDIVLPNKMIYRKSEGIWFHGKCRSVHGPAVFNWVRIIGEPILDQRFYDGDNCNCLYRIN